MLAATAETDIQSALRKLCGECIDFERGLPRSQCLLDLLFGFVDTLPCGGPIGSRERSEGFELFGELAFFAKPPHTHLVEVREVATAGDLGKRALN